MAAAEAEGASAAAVPGSGADGSGKSPGVEGEGGGAVGKEKDAAAKGAEAVGDSEDDGEDVFEVEKILDMKIDGVHAGPGPGGGSRAAIGAAGVVLPAQEALEAV